MGTRRTTWFACAAIGVAAVAGGCGSSGGGSSTASTAAAAAGASTGATAAASSAAQEITVLEHQDLRAKVLKEKLIPAFEAAEKKAGKSVTVKLVHEPLPDDQFATKLTLQYGQGSGPDVTSFVASAVPDYAAAGYLLDLTDRTKAWPDWQSRFYPVVRDLLTGADGKVYALPRGATLLELFYRKDVLDRLGISTAQPATLDEFVQRMKQITAKTGKPSVVWPAGTQWGGGTFDEGFIHVALGTGATLYDSKASKWIVQSKAITDAFSFYASLAAAKTLPTAALLGPQPWQPTKNTAFPKGDLPVTTSGTWAWRYDWGPEGGAPIPNLEQKVATWQFPTSDGSKPFGTANLDWVWAISKSTKHADAAWDFVKFVNSGPALAEDMAAAGALSPRDDIKDVAPYAGIAPLVKTEPELKDARFFKPATGIAKVQQAVGEATERILTGKADGPKAAADFAGKAKQLLGDAAVEAQ